MYWEEFETLPRFKLEKLQVERLKKTLEFASQSPFYGELFKQKGIFENSIKNVEDVRNLPFTTKQDLRDNFPYGFLGSPKKDLIRLHSSSGTTGNPTVIFHNRHDIANWANLMARSLFCAGVRDEDGFQNTCMSGVKNRSRKLVDRNRRK